MRKFEASSEAKKADREVVGSLLHAAEAGILEAQVALGLLYETGSVVAIDLEKAREMYSLAASAGSPIAMLRLSRIFELAPGESTAPLAFQWAKKAADANFAPGIVQMARLIENGIGVAVDVETAQAAYGQAAELGYGPAAAYLAMAHELGTWGRRDHELAVHFAALAASLGEPGAAQLLGRAYEDGAGVARDNTLALAWYTKAAENGDSIAALRLTMAYSVGGLGVVPDLEKAKYFSALADKHHA